MLRAALLVMVLGCNSYVGPKGTSFVPAYQSQPMPQVTEQAVTVRGIESVLAAGGRYVGVVVTDSDAGAVSAVRHAGWEAALRGGTHILLREAEVTHVDSTTAVQRPPSRDGGWQSTVAYVPVRRDDVHAVFDVFRVEPDHWQQLHPQMRPPAIER